jgi:hypothetical protein
MKAALAILPILMSACLEDYGPWPSDDQRLWCGDELCRWSVEVGQARPEPTWNELDPDVRLSGTMARLSRVDAIPTGIPLCVLFGVNVNVPEGTRVRLDVDLGDDGTVEKSYALAYGTNSARELEPLFRYPGAHSAGPLPGSPTTAGSARVHLVKEGPDDAVLFPSRVAVGECPAPDAGLR